MEDCSHIDWLVVMEDEYMEDEYVDWLVVMEGNDNDFVMGLIL